MEKTKKLTTKKLILIIVAVFVVCACGLVALLLAGNKIKEVASEEDYGYVNPDETKAEADAGFAIDGVLDEAQYQNNNWLYLHNAEGGSNVDIAMTSYYGEKGMYFVYDVTEQNPIYVNTSRASYLNSCIEMYLAPSSVTSLTGNSIFEIDLLPTGDMTFKKSNGKGGYVNAATTDDMMAVLGATTKGGEVNTEQCYGYVLELFIPWDYMEKLGMEVDDMKNSFVYVDPAHITSFNYAGTDTNVDRYWYYFAQQQGAAFSNVYQYFRFNEDGVLGTTPTTMSAGEHCTIEGDPVVIPGMKTTYTITPEAGYAINSVLVNGEEYITKVSYTEDGAVLLTIRGKVEGLEIKATAEAVTDGNKTLSGTIKVNGGTLSGISASYIGPTGEKPIEVDGSGNFVLTDLKQGYYTITVEKEGFDKLIRGIYVNRDITTELVLEYPTFTVTGGTCWILDNQNEGILTKFGGTGYLMSTDSYKKFTVEANFKYDEELAKEYDDDRFTQQRQGYRIKFSNEKTWHIDVMKDGDDYIVQYAKFSGDNSVFKWKIVHVMSEAEIAKFTSKDGIKLEVQRDGKYANVYLDDTLIAIEVLDDEYASCTAQIGFESWVCNRDFMEIPYKITGKTDVDLTKGYFKSSKEWDLTGQYNGVIKLPADHDGDSGWLDFVEKYQNVDMTFNLKDYNGDGTELRTVVKFIFENEQSVAISLTNADGTYMIQSMGDTLYGWKNHYSLTDAQIAKFRSADGIDLRIVRYGTEMTIYLDGEQVAVCDLTVNKKKEDTGITASMPAKVTIRQYGNEGHAVEIPFTVTETLNPVTITSVEGTYGKVVTEKQNYIVGDTVVLSGEGKDGYYCTAMKVNGKDVTLNWDGTYTFKATEKNYTVEGTFAERVFKDSKEWNLLKQNEGVISLPADHDGDSGYVNFYKQYEDIDLTLTTRDYIGDGTELRTVVKFTFENEQSVAISLTNAGGTYMIQSMGDTLYGWKNHYSLTEAEIAKFQSAEGMDFRLVRIGTEVLIYLDDTLVKVCDLTVNKSGEATEITADMPATVSIRHYGNEGYAAEFPFEVSDTVADVIDGQLTLENGGRVDTVIRNYAEDLDLTLLVKDYDDEGNTAARTDVLFVFENGAHVSFGVCKTDDGSCIIQSLNASANTVNDEETAYIYKRYQYWGALTEEETAQYLDGGVEFRVVRIGTEVSLYINDRFVAVADLTNNNRGVEADTKAKVTVRHYDDAGVKVEIPFEWTEIIDLVDITCVESKNGTVATNKKNYFVGDTVILSDGANDGYYCTGMKVNGEAVDMNWDGTYTFTASEKEYTVEGSFAKAVFKPSSEWNLMQQNVGIVTIPSSDGDSGWLESYDQYGDLDLKLTLRDQDSSAGNFRAAVRFSYTNGEYVTFTITNDSTDDDATSVYEIQNMGGSILNWKMPGYTLTDEQVAKLTGAEGLELRIVRVGDAVDIYLDGTHAWEADLAKNKDGNDSGVKDLTSNIQLRFYGNTGYDVELPFSIADAPTPVEINIADTANGTITTKEKTYFAGEEVVLVVTGANCNDTDYTNDYYYTSLKVNGEEVTVDLDGTYTFTATEAKYDVTGSFAKTIFRTNQSAHWSVANQHKGVVVQKDTFTGNSANLEFVKKYVNSDVTITIKANEDDFNEDGTLKDKNGDRTAISYWTSNYTVGFGILLQTNGKYYIGNSAKYNGYDDAIYALTEEETKMITEGDGIDLRVIRIGSEAKIYLEDKYITTYKLPYGETEETVVFIKRWDDGGVLAPIPYKISENVPDMVAIDIPDYANGTVATEYKNYLANEEVTITVTPKDGYDCTSFKVNGAEVALVNGTYTFTATEMNYTVEAVFEQKVNITIADTANGKITKAEEQYYVGDTVVLTVAGDTGYYYNSLQLNGEDIMLDWDGTYTFTATEANYEVTGSFAEKIFKDGADWDNKDWKVVNQNVGVLGLVGDGYSDGWVATVADTYKDVTLTLHDYVENSTDFRAAVQFDFTNGKVFRISLTNADTGDANGDGVADTGVYKIQAMGSNTIIGNWGSYYYLSDAEVAKLQSADGIKFRIALIDTMASIFIDDVKVCDIDLSAGISADATARVYFRMYGNTGYDVEIPFVISGEKIPVTLNIQSDIENGTITADKESYYAGDTVVFTVSGDSGYYYNSLKINGEEVMVDSEGTYTFKATELSYEITGSFAESVFETTELASFDLMNQHKGIVYQKEAVTGNSPWLKFVGTRVNSDTSIIVKAGTDDFNEDGTLKDTNGDRTAIGFANSKTNAGYGILLQTDGTYHVAHSGTYNKYNSFYDFTEEETKKIKEEGIELRVIREGAEVHVYLDGKFIKTCALPFGENEATTTFIRRWDDGGVCAPIGYKFAEKLPETVTINVASLTNGTITTDKTEYIVGEQVVLTVAGADGYACNCITVDGEEVSLAADGTYTFKATKTSHEVDATFAASLFATNANWNVQGQFFGNLFVPANTNGNTGWLNTSGNYSEVSAVARDLTSTANDYALVLKLEFANGKWVAIRLTDVDTNGVWRLQSMGDSPFKWGTHYTLTDEEIAQVTGEGLEFKMVRKGTTLELYLGGNLVKELDLTKNSSGITADMKVTGSGFRIYGNNDGACETVVPYTLIEVEEQAVAVTFSTRVLALLSDITSLFKED